METKAIPREPLFELLDEDDDIELEELKLKQGDNNNFVFEIKQILELADDLSLKPFSQKSFKVNYWFFDAQLDAAKVAVGGN
jgi:hypothetical protein